MELYLRGKVWWVSEGSRGRRVRMSTGCRDRKEAERKARLLLLPVLSQPDDAVRVATASALMEKARRDYAREASDGLLLAEVWELFPYRGAKGRPVKDSVVRNARVSWECFVGFCAARGVRAVHDVTPRLAKEFLGTLGQRRYAVDTFYVCRNMFARLGLPENPFREKPVPPRAEATHREPLTREQIAALLEKADFLAADRRRGVHHEADADELALLVRVMLYTGLRLGDAATLRPSQIDFQEGVVERTMAKVSRPVRFPVMPSLLEKLPRDGEFVFPSLSAKYRRDPHALTTRFRRLFQMAGIRGEPGQYCAHCLRTTFASICAERGIPIAVIQSWLGHSSQEVTRIYTRVEDMRAKRKALEMFPNLG
jgi:integrase